jgi:ATP-dependent DNA helicase RecG
VIEGAERFGLSQLHQLRGRVGRGDQASMCILISRTPLNDFTVQRLDAFVKTDNGFELSDIDLQLRGAGEFLGQRQSGIGEFRVANIVRDAATMIQARRDARFLLFGGQ